MGLTLLSQWISRRKNANKNHNKPTNYHRMVYNKTKINKYFNIQLKLYRNCITLPRDNVLTIHQFASKQKKIVWFMICRWRFVQDNYCWGFSSWKDLPTVFLDRPESALRLSIETSCFCRLSWALSCVRLSILVESSIGFVLYGRVTIVVLICSLLSSRAKEINMIRWTFAAIKKQKCKFK